MFGQQKGQAPAASTAPSRPAEPTAPALTEVEKAYLHQAVSFLALPAGAMPLTPGRVAGDVGLALHAYEALPPDPLPPLPPAPEPAPGVKRFAPTPAPAVLRGAYDRKGFLVDEDGDLSAANLLRRADADARYHLFELVGLAKVDELVKDARTDVRHSALIAKPDEYRGQVIGILGQVRWIKVFEMKRQLPGVKTMYQALITVGTDPYWVMFPDLPQGLPPETEWNQLYLHDVAFHGYFYKVLLAENEKGKTFAFPVLVGRTLEMPPPAEVLPLDRYLWIVLMAVGGAGVVLAGLFWWHGLGERRYLARMAALRARVKEAAENAQGEGADTPRRPSVEPSEN
jgi:hypothetical protein